MVRIRLPEHVILDAKSAEDVVAHLYKMQKWQVLSRRFRIRGSEIDLATIKPESKTARIVEIKLRRQSYPLDLTFTEGLLPPRKIVALRRGAQRLRELTEQDGLKLHWSFDIALVVPETHRHSCLVYTWHNAIAI